MNPRLLIAALGPTLASCWLSDVEVREKIDSFDPPVIQDTEVLDVIELISVEPNVGTAAGDSEITITADPLDSGIQVLFGGKAAEVIEFNDGSVTVLTPAAENTGYVDIDVRTTTGEGTTANGFYYWPDGTGKIGAIGAMHWDDYQLDISHYLDNGTLWFAFVEPTSITYDKLFSNGPLDTCVNGYQPPLHDIPVIETDGGSASFTSGAETISINYLVTEETFTRTLDGRHQWIDNASYTLEIPEDPPFPSLHLTNFAKMPDPLTLSGPTEAQVGGVLPEGEFDITWDTLGTGDYVIIIADRQAIQSDSLVYQERVNCIVADDGLFRMNTDSWEAWNLYEGERLQLQVGRVREVDTLLPHNNSRSGMAGAYWGLQILDIN